MGHHRGTGRSKKNKKGGNSMKQFITLVVIMLIGYAASAQSSFSHTTYNPTGSITNTGVDTMTYQTSASYTHVTIQPVYTRTSGTLAGIVKSYYSVNGSTYIWSGDSLILSNAATNSPGVFNYQNTSRYWRLITTGSGTTVYTTAAKISAAGQ